MSARTVPVVSSKLVSSEHAGLIAALDPALVETVIRLSSLGFPPSGIVPYCASVAAGEHPVDPPVATGPKELTVQAYSFLSDQSICVGKYGMSLGAAAELRAELRADPEKVRVAVHNVVAAHLAARGSPRAVRVTLDGLPAAPGSSKGPGGSKSPELSELMRRHQGLAGLYTFRASPFGTVGPEHFIVKLGGNLATVGSNMATAEKAARLVRVLGRHHTALLPYIRLFVPPKSLRGADKIPEAVYDGTLSPEAALPADDKSTGGSTTG